MTPADPKTTRDLAEMVAEVAAIGQWSDYTTVVRSAATALAVTPVVHSSDPGAETWSGPDAASVMATLLTVMLT